MLTLTLTLMWGCSSPDVEPGLSIPPANDAELGGDAPDFTIPSAEGGSVVLSEHEGDVILLSLSGFT